MDPDRGQRVSVNPKEDRESSDHLSPPRAHCNMAANTFAPVDVGCSVGAAGRRGRAVLGAGRRCYRCYHPADCCSAHVAVPDWEREPCKWVQSARCCSYCVSPAVCEDAVGQAELVCVSLST